MMKIFDVGKPKKASLSLSMNAIVILILAIAMLGLGLTFIRGIFKGVTAKVDEAVSAGEITNPPTRDNPVTITPSKIELREKQTAEIKVAFMSPVDSTSYMLQVLPTGGEAGSAGLCVSGDAGTTVCDIDPVYSTNIFLMSKDQINMWTIAISPVVGSAGNVRLYTAKICEASGTACTAAGAEYRKDFVVTIKD